MMFWKTWTKRGRQQALLLTAGLTCLGLGIWRTEVATVLQKAVYICLECIGIG